MMDADDNSTADRPAGRGRTSARAASAIALAIAIAVLALVVAGAVGLAVRDDGSVRTGDETPAGDGPAGTGDPDPDDTNGTDGAVVAVTLGTPSVVTDPTEVTLRFLDADGEVIAERSWSEVEQPTGPGESEVSTDRGLVQRAPAGDLRLDATGSGPDGPVSCSHSFTAAAGDRLVIRLGLRPGPGAVGGTADDDACATVETVEQWAAQRTSTTGEPYVGLAEDEADDRASREGLVTRVVGRDGVDLMVTMDFRPDRLNLLLFDGVVVAAHLDGEAPVTGPA